MSSKPRRWRGQVFIAASLDGYIAEPDGDLEWLTDPPSEPRHVPAYHGPDAPPDYEAFTAGITHLVMGRGTYEKVLTFHSWPYERFRVIVISSQLADGEDHRVRVVGSVDEACALLEQQGATSVYLDGGQIVTEFLAQGLVDELTISRAPVLLGRGLPLFHALPAKIRLIHLGTSTTDTGMTSTRYRVAS